MQIRIEVLPWMSELLNGTISKKVVLDEALPEGESLRGLLLHIHARYERFGRMVFHAQSGELTGHAEIVVNGAVCEAIGGLDATLHDGDIVTFLPAIVGG
jgi:molybdopterin converting factor small subunit